MQKDYEPSQRFTLQEIEDMKVPYAFVDSCVDQIMDYRLCVHKSKYSFLPGFGWVGPCRQLYDRWIICQSNREFEIKEKRRISLQAIEDEHIKQSQSMKIDKTDQQSS